MKYLGLIIFAMLIGFSQCNKDEHKKEDSTDADYRDTLIGTYMVRSFTAKSHFNTPPFYDSVFYANDTLSLMVYKSPYDTLAIVINADTLKQGASDNVTKRFLSGCCDALHMAVFRNDSITYSIQDAGTAVSSESHGWIGKKQ